ncbi:hypothetical protein [Mycolicibacterium fortuitum]
MIDIAAWGSTVLVPAVVLIAGSAAFTYVDYVGHIAYSTPGPRMPVKTWLRAFRKRIGVTRVVIKDAAFGLARPADERATDHALFVQESARQFELMLVCGSIGLAAWSQLFVSSENLPANRLSGLTLGLLFAGSACLLAAPLIWRRVGTNLTAVGRDAVLRVGFSLIVVSLAAAVIDLHIRFGAEIGVLVAYGIAAREIFKTVTDIGMHRTAVRNLP